MVVAAEEAVVIVVAEDVNVIFVKDTVEGCGC